MGQIKKNTKEKSSFKLTYEIWEPDNSEKMDTDVKWRLFGMAMQWYRYLK